MADAAGWRLPKDLAAAETTHCVGSGALIHSDCLETMAKFPDGSFKVVITSPPYNLRESTGGFWKGEDRTGRWVNAVLKSGDGYENHEDAMPRPEYIEWQRACLTEMVRLIRPDGAVFYNHKSRVQGGIEETPEDIIEGFPRRQTIVLRRRGGMNFNDNYFVPSHEWLYMITGPDFMLLPGMNKHGTVWDMPHPHGNPHPAPFHESLPTRILGSIGEGPVLDPFMGSGTTAVAAERVGRCWVGIEKSAAYVEQSLERIRAEADQGKLF